MTDSVCIVVAAKNEGHNIGTVIRLASLWGQVVVVDNASTDGTPDVARESGARLIRHAQDEGIARSYLDGLGWALDWGFDKIVQLDAGLSFDPADIWRLLALDADLVVGCRPWHSRKVVSLLGSVAIRALTGLPYWDATSGFRCWKALALKQLDLEAVECQMHGFQVELLWQAWRAGLDIKEVRVGYLPGRSSANKAVAIEALRAAWRMRR